MGKIRVSRYGGTGGVVPTVPEWSGIRIILPGMLWALVTLILFSSLLISLAAAGPLRGTTTTRPLLAVAALQFLCAALLIVVHLAGVI